jgi:hypothetical protein
MNEPAKALYSRGGPENSFAPFQNSFKYPPKISSNLNIHGKPAG